MKSYYCHFSFINLLLERRICILPHSAELLQKLEGIDSACVIRVRSSASFKICVFLLFNHQQLFLPVCILLNFIKYKSASHAIWCEWFVLNMYIASFKLCLYPDFSFNNCFGNHSLMKMMLLLDMRKFSLSGTSKLMQFYQPVRLH